MDIMKKLIERSFEVYNNLRLCIAVKEVYGCRLCPYYKHGCRYTPMLDIVDTVKRVFEGNDNG